MSSWTFKREWKGGRVAVRRGECGEKRERRDFLSLSV